MSMTYKLPARNQSLLFILTTLDVCDLLINCLMFPINIETIVIQYVALLFSDKYLESALKREVNRTRFNIQYAMNKFYFCRPMSASTFIGAFELFASNPDFEDRTANLNRSCIFNATSQTLIGQRSASVSHGDTLLSLVIMIIVCRMLLQ